EAERAWYFNREHAWFAGYAPARSPEIAVVALVEHGGFGGKHAAPIVFDAVRAYLQYVRGQREGARAGVKDGAKGQKKGRGGAP
ncbi:MAG: penicillin-binding transpeptidase domain-containing protein, partial [Myxococcales bacterium]